jgi:hypothetical protein
MGKIMSKDDLREILEIAALIVGMYIILSTIGGF